MSVNFGRSKTFLTYGNKKWKDKAGSTVHNGTSGYHFAEPAIIFLAPGNPEPIPAPYIEAAQS